MQKSCTEGKLALALHSEGGGELRGRAWSTWDCGIYLYSGFWNAVGGVTISRLFACIRRSFRAFPAKKRFAFEVKTLLAAFLSQWKEYEELCYNSSRTCISLACAMGQKYIKNFCYLWRSPMQGRSGSTIFTPGQKTEKFEHARLALHGNSNLEHTQIFHDRINKP